MTIKSKIIKQTIGLTAFALFVFSALGVSLKMEFTSQAPEGNWGEPWYNDCEEVSIVMVDSFYNNRKLTREVAKKEILRIIDIKEKAYGPSLDENAEEMVDLINNYLNWKAWIVENPTINQIKEQIDNGHPVLLPADGRKLDNRYYTTTEYHVFVISGYDDDKKTFIVQDAGTYHGKDYQYSYATVQNAMHDYDPIELSDGRRVAIFTSPEKDSESGDAGKIDEPKITPSPKPTISNNDSGGEVKESVPAVAWEKDIEDSGLLKTIKGYWDRLIEWVKSIYRRF